MKWPRNLALASLTLAAAIPLGFAVTHHRFVKSGHPPAEGRILLVGRIAFVPRAGVGSGIAEVFASMTDDLAQPVVFRKKGAKIDEQETLDLLNDKTSYVSITPGTRFIRLMKVPTGDHGPIFSIGGFITNPGKSNYLGLGGDLKITVPDRVKAVYIGTIVYRHNGTKATRLEVRDDYSQAMADMAIWKVRGIARQDVVKRLAQVVRQP